MEKLLTGPNLMFLGLMIWSGMLLRNTAKKSQQSRGRNVTKEWQTELRAKQRTAESQIRELEVRLYDYDRTLTARIDTTLEMLDQLIAEADREIGRLETLLETRRGQTDPPLSAEQRRMVVHLQGAGYSIPEIARLVDRPQEQVASVLDADPSSDAKAA